MAVTGRGRLGDGVALQWHSCGEDDGTGEEKMVGDGKRQVRWAML